MGDQFALGFSPERIDPGNRLWTLATTPKIVSGIDVDSLKRTAAFYGGLVEQVVPVGRCEEAELAKLLENTFRAVNIALINELAEVARDTGLDLRAAVAAAETKPFGFMRFDHGPGIGGHCLPIDPVYLSWWAEQTRGQGSRMIDLAAQINAARPAYVVNRVSQSLSDRGLSLAGARVLLLGLAYKPGSGDFRESPALEVATLLAGHGAQVSAADPFADPVAMSAALGGVRLVVASDDELTAADAVVLLTDHEGFDYDRVAAHSPFVLDCRGRLSDRLTATVEQL
jgi:UDP-N-acetyl-D-glucosamine dehydrogenase